MGLEVSEKSEPPFESEDEKKVLLSINRFERKKNIGLAIEAFSRLSKDERSNSRLVIAGECIRLHIRTPILT